MSKSQIYSKEYEQYLLSGKESSLDSLINGSIEKDYFFLIKKLLTQKYTQKLKEEINSFIKRIPKHQSYRLQALNIFKQISEFPEEKKDIIKNIKNLFDINELYCKEDLILNTDKNLNDDKENNESKK